MPAPDEQSDVESFERPEASFARTLERLKREGCSVLVCGTVAAEIRAKMTRQLFGSTEMYRRRILGHTGTTALDPDAYLPAEPPSDRHAVVVSRAGPVRASDTSGVVDVARAVSEYHPSGGSGGSLDELDALGTALAGAVDEVADRDHLSPGVLRVGVTSLEPYLDADGVEEVVRFVRTVAAPVHEDGGMLHVHVPLSHDDARVRALLPYFDARIDLRVHEPLPPECRWYLPAIDEQTTWMRL
ncbi:DUF7504 family protein [Halomarina pelagica]|uniref:DUF7504 family protein n=1 Tax=Halomarina pelagica TaxID=2961599 RepID=UPI0020C2F7A1|nr:hypothetical protein [Halomarina sp. BND7]